MHNWKEQELLAPYTTLQVGGPADYFTEVNTEVDLIACIREANARNIPITILGGGSNIFVTESGVRGLVLKNSVRGIDIVVADTDVHLTAAAGEVFDEIVAHTVARGYWGIENLSHIPGTIGATPIQNVGAYGVEISERITSVRVYDIEADEVKVLRADECNFAYRDSIFKHAEGKKYVVLSITVRLSTTPSPQLTYRDLAVRFENANPSLEDIRNAVIEIRGGKFPDWRVVGTAGSFFKNPIIPHAQYEALQEKYPELPGFLMGNTQVKIPLGWILDKVCKLRGVREGNVGTYKGQALVLINYGSATAREIETFAHKIMHQVREETDIEIEWEVTKVT